MGEKSERIYKLNDTQKKILAYFFRGSGFTVKEICDDLVLEDKTIRGYITDIYKKLGVPDGVDKREWVSREYAEAYEYVFDRDLWESRQAAKRLNQEPVIFRDPPNPVVEMVSEIDGTKDPQTIDSLNEEIKNMSTTVIALQLEIERLRREYVPPIPAVLLFFAFLIFGFIIGAIIEHDYSGFMGNGYWSLK